MGAITIYCDKFWDFLPEVNNMAYFWHLMTGLYEVLYPCSPWYDASDEWPFACSGNATQSDVFSISHSENTSKNPGRPPQSKLAMKIHESTWTFMEFHGKKHGIHHWPPMAMSNSSGHPLGLRPSGWVDPELCPRVWSNPAPTLGL